MRVALLTREYPPEVYGGAGVHVEYLARELERLDELTVHAWGAEREEPDVARLRRLGRARRRRAAPGRAAHDVDRPRDGGGRARAPRSSTPTPGTRNLAGHLAKLTYGIPHVTTVHSLEPLRPWKAEQLGGGYALSSFCERTRIEGADAVIAVSEGMRRDILACYPALDPSARAGGLQRHRRRTSTRPTAAPTCSSATASTPTRPSVVFVGRITRQKGVPYLLDAALEFDPSAQLVLCAGAPDTPEIEAEVEQRVERLRAERGNVIWIDEMLPKPDVIQLLSHATVFACPSIYEPLGIVNLEAMACEAAVVATRHGRHRRGRAWTARPACSCRSSRSRATIEPRDPAAFAHAIAERVNELIADPARAEAMGRAGRERALTQFDWRRDRGADVAVYRG